MSDIAKHQSRIRFLLNQHAEDEAVKWLLAEGCMKASAAPQKVVKKTMVPDVEDEIKKD